jgi:hypothetical protein
MNSVLAGLDKEADDADWAALNIALDKLIAVTKDMRLEEIREELIVIEQDHTSDLESSKKKADPVMQPATEPKETPVQEEVPTKYRELKISPKDTKTKDVELADAKAQKAYDSFLTSKQKLDNIEAKIAEVKRAADAQIKQIREEDKEQKEQKVFQSAVERMAKLVEATKDKVMRIGDMLFTYVKDTKQVKHKMSDKEKLTKLYGYFTGAEEYIKKLEAEADTAVKEVTKKELIKSPYRESSIVKKQAGVQEALESLWNGLKKLYNISDKMEDLAATASATPDMEKKAQPMDEEQAKAELATATKAEIEMGEIDHKGGAFTADGVEHRFFWSEDGAEQEAISQVRQDLDFEPDMFNQDWLLQHVDEEKYLRDISMDITNWVDESPESYTSFLGDDEEPNEDGEYSEEQKERMVEGYLDDIRRDLLDWLKGLGYEGAKLAEHLGGYLDFDAAAEDAVSTDGWAHFLSRYDGNYDSTNSGIVFFREA